MATILDQGKFRTVNGCVNFLRPHGWCHLVAIADNDQGRAANQSQVGAPVGTLDDGVLLGPVCVDAQIIGTLFQQLKARLRSLAAAMPMLSAVARLSSRRLVFAGSSGRADVDMRTRLINR